MIGAFFIKPLKSTNRRKLNPCGKLTLLHDGQSALQPLINQPILMIDLRECNIGLNTDFINLLTRGGYVMRCG